MGRKQRAQYLIYIVLAVVAILLYLRLGGGVEGFAGESELVDVPFFIPHKSSNDSRLVANVPLTIYQSWHDNKVPLKMKETIYKLIEINPECDYYLYSDDKSRSFIKENFDEDVLNAFDSLKPGAYKSDLWRYCILYKNGGIYLDIKLYSMKSLIPIIKENPTIYVKDWPGSCSEEIGIYNAFMVSPPNNEIFKYCIDDIVNSCKLKIYKDGVLSITGPCLLGNIIKDNISLEFIQTLPFKLIWFGRPENNVEIQYNGDAIIKSYSSYREEQSKFQKTKHYSEMWISRDVYN